MISPREIFTALVFNQPPLSADAIVVLCGEDGEERLKFAAAMMHQNAARTLILTGGVDSESQASAKTLFPKAMGMGIAPDRIVVENESTNTRQQALLVTDLAFTQKWKRVLLIASCYHLPRAYLTFLKALQELHMDEEIRVVPVGADHLPWFKCPKGLKRTRAELYLGEMGKIELYREHCASFIDGADHLQMWEGL